MEAESVPSVNTVQATLTINEDGKRWTRQINHCPLGRCIYTRESYVTDGILGFDQLGAQKLHTKQMSGGETYQGLADRLWYQTMFRAHLQSQGSPN